MFDEAVAAFEETGVTQMTSDEADDLGRRAAERLQSTV
jgi:hypothetical protein